MNIKYRPQVVKGGIESSSMELLAVLMEKSEALTLGEIVKIAEGRYNLHIDDSDKQSATAMLIEHVSEEVKKEHNDKYPEAVGRHNIPQTDTNRFANVEMGESKSISDNMDTDDSSDNSNRFTGAFGETTLQRVNRLMTQNEYTLEIIQDIPHELKTKITSKEQDALEVVEALLKERRGHLLSLREQVVVEE